MKFGGYIAIIFVTALVATGGSSVTADGLSWYYDSLTLPSFTPPGWVISAAWTTIFMLTAIAAMLVWEYSERKSRFHWIMLMFLLNGLLNVFWSFLFFNLHELGLAVVEMTLLNLTTVALVVLSWRISKLASVLLLPYIGWVSFATYLAYTVWKLNS